MNKCLSALGLAGGLAGCTVGPDYHMPDVALPDSFLPPIVQIAQKTTRKPSTNLIDWWRSLHDPELDSLVSRAIESNLDLEIALARLQAARTQELVVIGESSPPGKRRAGVAQARGQTSRAAAQHRCSDQR